MTTLRSKITQMESVTRVGIIVLVLSLGIGIFGYVRVHGTFDLVAILGDFYANLSTELGSIAITVIVIDGLAQRGAKRNREINLKEQLVRDASSLVNDVALNAVHQIHKRGWLQGENGLLRRADLSKANLQAANLEKANLRGTGLLLANLQGANLAGISLQGAFLQDAKLQGADLSSACLQWAILRDAKLQRANLSSARLQGASLIGVSLQGAVLRGANLQGANFGSQGLFDESTILPDGTHWTPDTDMARFTDPNHPEFCQPPFSLNPDDIRGLV